MAARSGADGSFHALASHQEGEQVTRLVSMIKTNKLPDILRHSPVSGTSEVMYTTQLYGHSTKSI